MANLPVSMIGFVRGLQSALRRHSMNLLWHFGKSTGSLFSVLRSGNCCTGLTSRTKKDLRASEQKRPDVVRDRAIWINRRQPFMRDHLERLIFIDETALKTNMTKTRGWAPVGDRLIDHAPAERWNTQTFIAGLRHDRIDATGIINGAMNKEMFDLYVEGILAPTLRPGDVVILDNLPVHRSAIAASTLKEVGAWFLFLPKYSPDLNPIEMAFSKLKALIRKAAARTYDDLWRAVGNVCSLFNPQECKNFFAAAGYQPD